MTDGRSFRPARGRSRTAAHAADAPTARPPAQDAAAAHAADAHVARTNAVRLLGAHSVPHRLVGYEHDPDAMDAVSVAHKIGVEPETLFKTLVLRGDRSGPLVCCIPGPLELNLKKAASVSGNKRVSLIASRDLVATTGYERGACSPVAMIKPFPAYIDESALLFEEIAVSAGVHGGQILIAPAELARFIDADLVDLT